MVGQPRDERDVERRDAPDSLQPVPSAEPRTLLDRTKDEVQSWFGDPGALARRQRDEAVGDQTGKGPALEGDEDARILELRLLEDRPPEN